MTIEELARILDEIGLQYMATIGEDGRPKVRPVQFMVVHDGRLWFCTNSEKNLYRELVRSPYIDLCGSRLLENEIRTVWVRLSAKVVFEENRTVKSLIMAKSPIVHELYGNNPEHPLFKVFYLSEIRGAVENLGHVKGLKDRDDLGRRIDFEF